MCLFCSLTRPHPRFTLFPTRRSSDLRLRQVAHGRDAVGDLVAEQHPTPARLRALTDDDLDRIRPPQVVRVQAIARRQHLVRSEEHTSELQSHSDLVCRLLLEKKKR